MDEENRRRYVEYLGREIANWSADLNRRLARPKGLGVPNWGSLWLRAVWLRLEGISLVSVKMLLA